MADHYYSKKPSVESAPKYWDFTLRGQRFRFKTDSGVFSKGEVDFGSRLLIETFAVPDVKGPLLDVGCGYGPIGLALAKTYTDRLVHMIDVNERALGLAEENAKNNAVENIRIYESDRLEGVKETGFSAILTNPPIRAGKKTVHEIFSQSRERLADGGELWVVIQKKQGAPSAIEKLNQLFGEVEVVDKEKGYFIIRAKNI
ncbi:16S rRNA methyltransferase [Bacillus sp. FJAT-27225]|uniref:class I SAM-dependent methyltransferase n=1 Tax=Bacillus sp. FJAT-27225 TaxID=1743144 RepID=UPI00080C2FD7|nr:class I SAM-dependent methyltransferase [Bacillus sp. FJAT-27225]OCA81030.1 16S rRNA methyltransferase [Bacillus sp. FJAT-27225]